LARETSKPTNHCALKGREGSPLDTHLFKGKQRHFGVSSKKKKNTKNEDRNRSRQGEQSQMKAIPSQGGHTQRYSTEKRVPYRKILLGEKPLVHTRIIPEGALYSKMQQNGECPANLREEGRWKGGRRLSGELNLLRKFSKTGP